MENIWEQQSKGNTDSPADRPIVEYSDRLKAKDKLHMGLYA